MDIAVPHGITVFYDYGKFLGKYVKAVVAVPPGATSVELGRVAIELIMHAKTVGILAIALASGRVIVVVGVAVQKEMPTAARCAVVYKESRPCIVVAFNLLQDDVLTHKDKNAGV